LIAAAPIARPIGEVFLRLLLRWWLILLIGERADA